MTRPPTYIALCIDDFGLHGGIDAAVFDLAARARVSAVSCMVGGPTWRANAGALADLDAERVELGLHLDLTQSPLNSRLRAPLSRWIMRSWLRRADRRLLAAEIDDQLDAFEQTLGRRPAYVDGHQHVHQFPLVRELLLDALRARYSSSRGALPWLRRTRRSFDLASQSALGWRERMFKPWLIETLGARALEMRAKRCGHAMNRRLLGVHDFRADAAGYRRLLGGWLGAARDGDLLMCHPSLPHASAGACDDALLESRESEYAVLASDEFKALLYASNIRLLPIGRILNTRASGEPHAA